MPFHTEAGVTLFNEDYREVVKFARRQGVTCVYADPPYGMKLDPSWSNSVKFREEEYEAVEGDEDGEVARSAFKKLISTFPNAAHFWWGANHYAHSLPETRSWIFWNKVQILPSLSDGELCWTNTGKGLRMITHQWSGAQKQTERGQRRIHPTQKPVELARIILHEHTECFGTVFIPFAGSGSEIVAARRLNLNVIACELSEEYCELIKDRLWKEAHR